MYIIPIVIISFIVVIYYIVINKDDTEDYNNVKLNSLRGLTGGFYVNCRKCNDNKYVPANDKDMCSYSPNRIVSRYCDIPTNKLMYFYDKNYKLVPQSVCVNGLLEDDYVRSLDEFLTNGPVCL